MRRSDEEDLTNGDRQRVLFQQAKDQIEALRQFVVSFRNDHAFRTDFHHDTLQFSVRMMVDFRFDAPPGVLCSRSVRVT
jgi:hypothetical protein